LVEGQKRNGMTFVRQCQMQILGKICRPFFAAWPLEAGSDAVSNKLNKVLGELLGCELGSRQCLPENLDPEERHGVPCPED
jgi:hypothetical protein